MGLSAGDTLNHYRVIAPLGVGGMGEVYVAEDTKLERRIALKVLPSEMAEDSERLARFRREAVAVAALNHPNIVTIHSVEESEGAPFLTMELVEGEQLSERIPPSGLGVPALLEIATPLAKALAAAHAKGITHRDLKPQNVMIARDGSVKVLDFGLAKMQSSFPGANLDSGVLTEERTQEGAIVGTLPYMSPEQARGRSVDSRSDIFSLGVILYEMASGRRPFSGDGAITLLSSILKDEPKELVQLPGALNETIRRCLAKDPDVRFQTGEELCRALTSTHAGAVASSDVPWLAVRPFKARGDEALVSFAEGLTEDIVAGLALFSHLSVFAESSPQARAERFVLEGALRKAGTKVRVSIKLIDCATGAHLWAEQFDRDLGAQDVFAAQDELTDRIVATVADPDGVLTRSLIAIVKRKQLTGLSAHECVLRCFGYLQQWRRDEHAELRGALERAVEREPDHAEAWACLSGLYLDEHRYHYNPKADPVGRALKTAHRAVDLDATSQLAYRALADVHYFRRELTAFRSAAERALALNPRDTANVAMMGHLIFHSGSWEEGISIIRQAMQMNPHHAGWLFFLISWYHYRRREYQEALEAAEKVNMPGYVGTYVHLTACNAQVGNMSAAREHLQELLRLSPRYGKIARRDLSKWFGSPEFVEHILEGLAKAGLDIPPPDSPTGASAQRT